MSATVLFLAFFLFTFHSIQAQEKSVVRVGFASVSWDTQLPIRVAMVRGFFKAQGLTIEHVFVRGGATVIAALIAGGLDFADMGAQAPIRARAKGAEVYIVGTLRDKVTYALLGTKGTKSAEELKGKAIGVTGAGSFSEFVVRMFLKKNNLDPDRDVTLRAIGGTALRAGALENGLIAAAPFTSEDAVQLLKKGFPLISNLSESLEIPHTVIATRGEVLERYPETTRRFLKSLVLGLQIAKKDKKEAIRAGFEAGLKGDPEIVSRAYDLYAPAFTWDLSVPRRGIQVMIDEDIRSGLLPRDTTVEKVINDKILKKAQEELR